MDDSRVVMLNGSRLGLSGKSLSPGDRPEDFNVLDADLKDFSLKDFSGKIKLIMSVPSLDTPVCDLEVKRFNKEALELSDDVVVLSVSMDLPFAIKRFCAASGVARVKVFSDHRSAGFAQAFGVLIKELRLLSRAVFILDGKDTVKYVQYVPELTSQPDYESVLKALKELLP